MFIKRLFRRLKSKLITKLGIWIYEANSNIASETLPQFGNNPQNLVIELPRKIINPQYMFLGNDIWIGSGSLLMAITKYPGISTRYPGKEQPIQNFTPKITIGNRVTSTATLQLAAMCEITIEDDVIFASNVNITDGLHGYENTHEPYKYQKMFKIAPIRIKQGSWIGQNVVILPGVTIGEFSIVGANSVVTKDIPDRCIAIGTPAKVTKKWDTGSQKWTSVANG